LKAYIFNILLFFLIASFLTACSQSGDQREFEQQAIQMPEGYTQTNGRGDIVNDNIDPDDWRVAPFFQGIVQVDPAFPNPVLSNDRVTLRIFITGVDAVSGIRVFSLYNINQFRPLYEDMRSPIPTGLLSISLNPLEIAQTPENPQGLYRIIVEDGSRNIITYGDIKIE